MCQSRPWNWAINSAERLAWEESQGGILLYYGPPGVGKSTIAYHLVDGLQTKYGTDLNVAVIDVFFPPEDSGPGLINHTLCTILRQLCNKLPTLPEAVIRIAQRQKAQKWIDCTEIMEAIKVVAEKYSRIFISVDGVDECGKGMGDVRHVLHYLFSVQRSTKANLFATSREIPEIIDRFKSQILPRIRARNKDLKQYLNDVSAGLPFTLLKENGHILIEIERLVVSNSDGMLVRTNALMGYIADSKLAGFSSRSS